MAKLMKLREASELLGVTSQTLINWANSDFITIIQKNNSFYALTDEIKKLTKDKVDVSGAMKEMVEMRDSYVKEKQDYARWRKEIRDSHQTGRLQYAYYQKFISTGLYQTVLGLLEAIGKITGRDRDIATCLLMGRTVQEAGECFGLTGSTIQTTAHRIAKVAGDVSEFAKMPRTIREQQEHLQDLKEAIKYFKKENEELKEKLQCQTEDKPFVPESEEEEIVHMCDLLSTKLEDIGVSVRIINCAKAADIETLGDLIQLNRADILKWRHFGKKSIAELDDILESLKLSWGTDTKTYFEKYAQVKVRHLSQEDREFLEYAEIKNNEQDSIHNTELQGD